jgi:GTPase SAR1 family protein
VLYPTVHHKEVEKALKKIKVKKEEKFSELPFHCAVFGDRGVGKTATVVRRVAGQFVTEYDPTIEGIF